MRSAAINEQPAKFNFVADPALFHSEGIHCGHVRAGVFSKEQLMRILEEALSFPDYFGRNWDALLDCLRDLSWLPPGRVFLVHDAVPGLSSKDLLTYVDVLATATRSWKPQESHELVVVFPEHDRHRVLDLLAASPE